jgi:hypothetical protein
LLEERATDIGTKRPARIPLQFKRDPGAAKHGKQKSVLVKAPTIARVRVSIAMLKLATSKYAEAREKWTGEKVASQPIPTLSIDTLR